ncbi:hypothetical protein [Pseudonocardia asaccharolytica]|uniref:hypothetical protein n=2 Tax=Pseudonocardia asaccharolytica TaxID=54010 RepID=UPI00041DE0CB|nr:hypothetical protein [Pseudonocardia asaccharolytica]
MTTTRHPEATAPEPVRRALGWAAIAGTVPYLSLKTLWLTGSTVGVRDPALLHDRSIVVLNAVTVAMDLAVIALALALTQRWGRRVPGVAILLPTWVGTGFLLPMVAAILPATLLSALTSPPVAAQDLPLEGWVRPMVYGGFAWQGVFLLLAFVLYARDRWSAEVERGGVAAAQAPPARSAAWGGAVLAGLSAGLHLINGVISADVITMGVQTINAGLAVAGSAGVLALVRGTARRRWLAAVGAWTGSAAMFSWGLWAAVTTMGATTLSVAGAPLTGMAQLTGLLGGFALAVAALLALTRPVSGE